jgi:hypothetical protein
MRGFTNHRSFAVLQVHDSALPEIDTAQFRSEAMDPFARIAIGEDQGSPEE